MSLYKSCSFCYTGEKEIGFMTEEISELYARLLFHYESAIDALFAKGLIDIDLVATSKEKFYGSLNEEKLRISKNRDYHETVSLYMRQLACKDIVSLMDLARQYFEESPGCVIQVKLGLNFYLFTFPSATYGGCTTFYTTLDEF